MFLLGDIVFAVLKIKHMSGKYLKLQKGQLIEFHRLEKANHFVSAALLVYTYTDAQVILAALGSSPVLI